MLPGGQTVPVLSGPESFPRPWPAPPPASLPVAGIAPDPAAFQDPAEHSIVSTAACVVHGALAAVTAEAAGELGAPVGASVSDPELTISGAPDLPHCSPPVADLACADNDFDVRAPDLWA